LYWFLGDKEVDSWMIVNTFYSVFLGMAIWRGPHNAGFYMTGEKEQINIDVLKMQRAFMNKDMVKDLSEISNSCVTSQQLLSLLFQNLDGFSKAQEKYPIITDNNPYTEFPLLR